MFITVCPFFLVPKLMCRPPVVLHYHYKHTMYFVLRAGKCGCLQFSTPIMLFLCTSQIRDEDKVFHSVSVGEMKCLLAIKFFIRYLVKGILKAELELSMNILHLSINVLILVA